MQDIDRVLAKETKKGNTSVSIKIANVTDRDEAQPLVNLLQGKTYMDFNVGICPVGGSFDVVVNTFEVEPDDYHAEELEELSGDAEEIKRMAIKNEMKGLVMMVMADQLMKKTV